MLKQILAGILLTFFILRDTVCKNLYPEMKVNAAEWDGANNLTMDTFALIFFLAFLLIRLSVDKWRLIISIDLLLGIAFFDLLQRVFIGLRFIDRFDIIAIFLTIIFTIIDLSYILLSKKKYDNK
jgi:hypothetical protein